MSSSNAQGNYYIGVDVGTGSARALLVRHDGRIMASATQETTTWRDPEDHRIFEQSTDNIWNAIATCIRSCLSKSGIPKEQVKGLGFDATCSLAVADQDGEPVCVTKGNDLGKHGTRNIILWADHRAEKQADLINSTGSLVLDYVGGTMSLEMEMPKTLWLKQHMAGDLFSRCQLFDLPDFLTYRATRDNTRSCCSVTCKFSYVPTAGGWQPDFMEQIGMEELVAQGAYRQIGGAPCQTKSGARKNNVLTAGLPVGRGLSKQAAEELGLLQGTPVGSGLIDAYAGWMGTVAARYTENGTVPDEVPAFDQSRHRLAAVAGTSTCHIVQSHEGVFVNGVWGPYKDPVFPGWWMNEGGQSSTGQLIDFMITTHHAYPQLKALAEKENKNIHAVLGELIEQRRAEEGAETVTELTKDIHLYPDFHGNRSPIADSRMRGSIVGLELSASLHDLARKYHLTLEAIALQTRHIVDEMNAKGHAIRSIFMSGSQAKNKPMMQLFADVCKMPVILPADEGNAVVLGAAMLGRFAAEMTGVEPGSISEDEHNKHLWNIMLEMSPIGTSVLPAAGAKEQRLLEAKYRIFRETIDIQRRWRKEMEEACGESD
ncbi:Pentulose kinase [Fistulina hepatica ATCC 64428]|uniref:Pentulose kinase n=1 Tax=Fistulina hepatica ATCC 64428 TaxID=1128425 RepID=A0A0D7A5G7_9AGAR|nr:Pentulose kinase [Fistulina hepatica ATCC 64428]